MREIIVKILNESSGDGASGDHWVLQEGKFNEVSDKIVEEFKNFISKWNEVGEGEMPKIGQIVWVEDSKGDLYQCEYRTSGFLSKRTPKFHNLQGRGWPVDNVVRWAIMFIPKSKTK